MGKGEKEQKADKTKIPKASPKKIPKALLKNKNKTKDTKPKEHDVSTQENNNAFNFDMDSNILDKLNEPTYNKKHQKNNQISSWNYSDIINTESRIQKMKQQEKTKNLSLLEQENEDIKPKPEKSKLNTKNEPSKIEANQGKDEEQENFLINDKFENAIYAKGISFSNLNLSKLLVKSLSEMEFYTPTKVQEKVIPIALKGHDILVNSETGSGKTACFLLPIIQKIITMRTSKEKCQALILVPTRELALQCNIMLNSISKYIEISSAFLVGGMSVETQIQKMKFVMPDIIIATPGRLIDIIYNYTSISLENINILVLDEADKLLELGYKDTIMEILEIIKNNKNRQTMLFSATLNPKIIDLGNHALVNPIKIKIAQSAILTNLTQNIIRIKFENLEDNIFEKRMSYLLCLLKDKKINRTIIFFNTKRDCHYAFLLMAKFNITSCAELHSNIDQTERLKALDMFQKGEINYLLATDVAARGIDIDKVKYVINFQMPSIGERYIHRIGRTARKGYLGQAITIADDKERLVIKKILKKEKIDIKLNVIKITNIDVLSVYKEVIKYKEEISHIVDDENVELELNKAERDLEKTMNLQVHMDEIHNRPKKKWFERKKDKIQRSKQMRKEFKEKKEELFG